MYFTMRSLVLTAALSLSVNAVVANDELCFGKTEVATELDFYNSQITENDLHIGGVMRYSDIGVVRGREVDLVVSVVPGTTYESERAAAMNGKSDSEKFGRINLYTVRGDLESGQGNFRFCFHDKETGDPTTVDSFRFSLYDVDERNAAANGIKEKIVMDLTQAEDYFLWPDAEGSEIETYCEDTFLPPPCADGENVVFHSSTKGTGSDNPSNPNSLSSQQKKRSIVFVFKDTSCFDMTLEHYCQIEEEQGGRCRWYGGGNFLIAGSASQVVEDGECLVPYTDPPTNQPTDPPTNQPTDPPTNQPTDPPTSQPTETPTNQPTDPPTSQPTETPTSQPTDAPTSQPTEPPTPQPTDRATSPPTTSTTVASAPLCSGRAEMETNLDFHHSTVTENHLHEGGVIRYSDIGVVRGREVDLVVSVVPGTTYESERAALRNGKLEDFGQINLFTVEGDLESGKGDFRFCFHDKETGDLTTVDSFRWSAYDLDERNAAADGIKEKMLFDMTQAESYSVWPSAQDSEIDAYCEFSGPGSSPPCAEGERVVFHSSTKGTGSDNPRDPNSMTDQQKKRSVVFTFTNTSCWDFTYEHYCRIEEEEGGRCRWYGGGNFLFAGDARDIVERGECLTNPPTEAPRPTEEPTPQFEERGEPTNDDRFFPSPSCPSDVELILTHGVTEFPDIESIAAVEVLQQDTNTVTVGLTQAWDTSDSIDAIYYEYMPDPFNSKCYGAVDVDKGDRYGEATIQCGILVPKAKLKICLSDDLADGFLLPEDDARVPRCCKDPVPEENPTVCYILEIDCRPGCVGEDSQQAVRRLRGSN